MWYPAYIGPYQRRFKNLSNLTLTLHYIKSNHDAVLRSQKQLKVGRFLFRSRDPCSRYGKDALAFALSSAIIPDLTPSVYHEARHVA